MKGYFITGTDTDAGKTVASAAILSLLINRGIDAVPVKPAQTGCENVGEKLNAPDLDFTLKITGLKIEEPEKELLCPNKYKPACSPHLAAEMANEKIILQDIVSSIKKLSEIHEQVVVEGAGGIMVPLNDNEMMIDLMCLLELPVILVARPGLGTINHTLLSLQALRNRNIEVAGVLFCATKPLNDDFIEKDNIKSVEKFGDVRVLGTLPYIKNIQDISQKSFLEIANTYITIPD